MGMDLECMAINTAGITTQDRDKLKVSEFFDSNFF